MMEKAGQWVGYAVGAAALLALFWIGYSGTSLFLQASATAKLGVLAAAVSVATLIYNNARQQTREIKSRQFSDKRLAYQKFFDLMFDIFAANKTNVDISESDMVARMNTIMKDLMVWGSAETINQYNIFMRNSLISQQGGTINVFDNMELLMRSFRKDLGHDDKKLEKLGLSKLLVKADEHHKLDAGQSS